MRTTRSATSITLRMTDLWRACVARLGLSGLLRGEAGASLVEYTLLLSLIVLVALAAITFLGHAVTNSLNNSAGFVNSAP